jgi:hypothetical protein
MGGVARLFMMAHWVMFDPPTPRRDKEKLLDMVSFLLHRRHDHQGGNWQFTLRAKFERSFYEDEENVMVKGGE